MTDEQSNDFYTQFLNEHSFAEILKIEEQSPTKKDCLHRQTKLCKDCTRDYDPEHYPNNYNCPSYHEIKIGLVEKDADGKPIIQLTPLEETAVNTSTQEDYDTLMRVYECGGWKWGNGSKPTMGNNWNSYKANYCIDLGIHYRTKAKGEFCGGSMEWNSSNNWTIISPKDFYQIQKITPEMLNEISKFFEKK
ncbi:MAG: hypothetical protein Q7S33_02575 [Nanoarchaeota archaeon]|nr:hypothetical protein [Nanoarchaeota archaeon]